DNDRFIVSWQGEGDPADPHNWPKARKVYVSIMIFYQTAAVYIGSSVYAASIPQIMEVYDVSSTKALLGLSLFVLGYGVGPLFISPFADMPQIGRNTLYSFSLLMFTVLQIPFTVVDGTYSAMMFCRFFAGFFASPALSIGVNSFVDMYSGELLPYLVLLWAGAAVLGPTLGPVIISYAVMNLSWRWPFYFLTVSGGIGFILMLFTTPETYGEYWLLNRAKRIRKESGDDRYMTAWEHNREGFSLKTKLYETFILPARASFEPIMIYTNLFLGFTYGLFYLWFESFPLVYGGIYHFNQGIQGIMFIALGIGSVTGFSLYYLCLKYYISPRVNNEGPEVYFKAMVLPTLAIPIGLFIFGWTARSDIPWIAPTIGAAIYPVGVLFVFQPIIGYIGRVYYSNLSAVMISNCVWRSCIAAAFPLFGSGTFHNLGIGRGSSMLAGISIAMTLIGSLLIKYSGHLRRASKMA
ncbi:hypothetical protein CANCADRAFT_14557, partial [Tortispora caseinolytica NRRL Y-17796]